MSPTTAEVRTTAHAGAPNGSVLVPARPVRVEVTAGGDAPDGATTAVRVVTVVPCQGRRLELEHLLDDLGRLRTALDGAIEIDLRVLVVDNASEQPLRTVATPPRLRVEHLRLPTNAGGSGGFNAGLRHALGLDQSGSGDAGAPTGGDADLLWLLDSDARVRPDTLGALVQALRDRPDLCAAGSALADPATGRVFEVGGIVDRRSGRLRPAARGLAGVGAPIVVDYVASCSVLVRREAVLSAGLLPDVFLNTDDVQWCIRLARVTGGGVAAVPASVVIHPRFDRFATSARYYAARNALGPARALGLGAGVRLRRAWHEAVRAAAQEMMGRHDLAALHLRGLRDCAERRLLGPAPGGPLAFEPFHPLDELAERLRHGRGPVRRGRAVIEAGARAGLSAAELGVLESTLAAAGLSVVHAGGAGGFRLVARLLTGTGAEVGVVAAKGAPRSWARGRLHIEVAPGVCAGAPGFVLRRWSLGRPVLRAAGALLRGAWLSWRAALRGPVGAEIAKPEPGGATPGAPHGAPSTESRAHEGRSGAISVRLPTVSVVVLSHNRWGTLAGTVGRLLRVPALADAEFIVVDNASTDGSAERAARQFPRVRVERLPENIGVAAFNRAVAGASGEVVLVLDDDAWPDDCAVAGALEVLAHRPEIGAVAFHPRHPETNQSEWPFAARTPGGGADDRWPVMGCGNMVRRELWTALGGYEQDFFLYRNDADLALKILAHPRAPAVADAPWRPERRWGVYFDPAWTVWHQSPAARRKSNRWHRLATRNWIWMCRRHGRGLGFGGLGAALLGWAWAHRLAGHRPGAHAQTARGALEGWLTKPPAASACGPASGGDLRRLVMIRLGRGSAGPPAA